MSGWTVIVPTAAYLAIAFAIRRRLRSWRVSLLVAAVAWGLSLVVMTEGLSRFHLLTRPVLVLAWFVILAGAALLAYCGESVPATRWAVHVRGFDLESRVLLGGTGVLVLTLALIAIVAPPNTFDSMTYHMSRVAHWMQDASIEPYATGIQRQLYQSPGAEFVILHLQILSGGDRFANLVQWSSMVGSLLAASLVVQQLGGGRTAQVFAAMVVATIPMGILQASGTQNDYVAAFWIVAMLAIAMAWAGQPPAYWSWLVIAAGGALGLAILTKPTAYLFGVPFVVFISLRCVCTYGIRRAGLVMVVVGLVAAAVNAGHYSRNIAVYRSVFGPPADLEYTYRSETLRLASVVSTAIRNLALHVATPSKRLNERIDRAVRHGHSVVGLDPDDPRVTWRGERFSVTRWRPHEDHAGNLLHLLLIAAAVIAVVIRPWRHPQLSGYAATLTIAWLLFSAALKWQPWHSRLQLPFFVLATPLVAMAIGKRAAVRLALFAGLMIGALPALLWNESRPLAGRASVLSRDRVELYFSSAPEQARPYADAVSVLRELGCSRVGLAIGGDEVLEYALWVLTEPFRGPGSRIEHVGGAAQPRALRKSFVPCAVVGWQHRDALAVGDALYTRIWESGDMGVYAQAGRVYSLVPPWPLLDRLRRRMGPTEPSKGGRPNVAIRIETDGTLFHDGERLLVRIDIRLSPTSPPAAVYAGVLLPDGLHVMLFRAPNLPMEPVRASKLRELVPFTPPESALAGPVVLFDGRVSPVAPAGDYRIFAALATPSGPRSPDDDDFLAADVRTIHVAR